MLLARDPRGQGPKKGAGPVPGPGPRFFWVPGPWGPWPRACTRVLCMHKRSLVYTQEILLCIHNYAKPCETMLNYATLCENMRKLCEHMRNYATIYENIRNHAKLYETMQNYAKLYETMRNYAKLCETMKIGRPIPSKCVYLHAPAHRI